MSAAKVGGGQRREQAHVSFVSCSEFKAQDSLCASTILSSIHFKFAS